MRRKSKVSKGEKSIQSPIIKISHIRRHPKLNKQSQILSMKRKRLSNVIHIHLGLPNIIHPIKDNSTNSKVNSSNSSIEKELQNSIVKTDTTTSSSSSNFSVRQNLDDTQKHDDSNRYSTKQQKPVDNHEKQIGSIEDHHRKKSQKTKTQCVRLCICLLIIAVILIVIAAVVTLSILLSNKSVTTFTPSKNIYLRWNSSGITIAGTAGISGVNSTLLNCPYGLAFDSSKTLYIVDYINNRVQKLITDTGTCVTVAGQSNGVFGSAANQLHSPANIIFDSNDNMYISDRANARVQFWTKSAISGTTIAGGTSNISLLGSTGLVIDSNSGTLFIEDTYGNRVISYPANQIVAGGNGAGNGATNLYNPYGLAYDSVSRTFVISNYNTNNIVYWTLGATNRTLAAGSMIGTVGSTSALLNMPVGVTIDPMGNIYVADSNNHRIQFFLLGQSNGTTIAGTTSVSSTDSTHLNSPYWVILDTQLNLYVSDTYNHRVQKFLRY